LQLVDFLVFLERFHIDVPLRTFTVSGKEITCSQAGGECRWSCPPHQLEAVTASDLVSALTQTDPIDEKHVLGLVRQLAAHAGYIVDEAERLCGADDIQLARAEQRQFLADVLEQVQKFNKPLQSVPK
jgi:hypothetical protein